MQFFVDEKQRSASQSTCYLEFQKGHFSEQFWLANSINISGELWDKYHLSNLIRSVVKNFDYYGITEVTENFKEYDVFTIAGI